MVSRSLAVALRHGDGHDAPLTGGVAQPQRRLEGVLLEVAHLEGHGLEHRHAVLDAHELQVGIGLYAHGDIHGIKPPAVAVGDRPGRAGRRAARPAAPPAPLAHPVLHAEAAPRVLPGQRLLVAADQAGAALEAALPVDGHLALVVDLVEVGRAHLQAGALYADGTALLDVDDDVGLLVELEDVGAELGIDAPGRLVRRLVRRRCSASRS